METYKVLGTNHKETVENWYLLIKDVPLDTESLSAFVKRFRTENCKKEATIYMVDDASIYPLIREYPLNDEKFLKVARHFIALAVFDTNEVWKYPYLDESEYPGEENDDVEEWQERSKVKRMVKVAEIAKNKTMYAGMKRKFGDLYYNTFRKVGDPIA
ncbi:MAG: hypothetical protein LBS55_01350 [Prevotellaceae bacterium]|jgi:hypothetical protein|nr:hypothetical protein [Prevotellaceae bacterium]